MRLLVTLLVAACAAFAGTISLTIDTRPGDVALVQKDGFTVATVASDRNGLGTIWTTEPGEPLLPVYSGNVSIPAGAELTGITVKSAERSVLGTGIELYPVQPMRPLSQLNSVAFVAPKASVYSSQAVYPAQPLNAVPAGSKTGFRIAGFTYCPFEYRPASGELTLISRVVLEVSYRENATAVPVLSVNQRDMAQEGVTALVMNTRDVARWAPPAAELDAQEIDVVIVTSATLKPALADFQKYLRRKGFFTTIVTTDTIYARYTGYDNPEKIRNMLKEKFAQNGLKYVILAGDVQHVPCRTGYLPYSPYNVPADVYFGDLDGTWDTNGNHQFGEMTDSVDLFADICYGRLPFDDASNVANFLKKDSTYELVPDTAYLDNVLLPFEDLWSNIDFYGRIVNKNIALALNRMSSWQVDSALQMPPATVVAGINAGRHLFHFAGHGATTMFGSTFSTSNLPSLTNVAKPVIVNSMACDCGDFDQTECLGEQFINITNGGAVSTATNARFGWGAPPTMGPSENLCMEFYNNYIKGMDQGQANTLAKDFYRNAAFSQLTYRWSVYDWTFQGDPTMRMWRGKPEQLAVTAPAALATGPQMVEVSVDCGDQAAPGARIAITHNGELLGRGVANSQGWASFPITGPGDTWTVVMTVHAQDAKLYEQVIPVSGTCPNALVTLERAEVFDGNGRLDPNENTAMYVVARNLGSAPATATYGLLRSLSPHVVVTDSLSFYGSIASGDTARGTALEVTVSRDCPHGATVEFQHVFWSGADTWQTWSSKVVGMPNARGGMTATHDTADFAMTVCANGGIGTTWWRGEGYGFIYPKVRQWSSSALMHGSFMLGTDTSWVADNFYGTPWRETPQDFAMVESLRMVYPPQLGNQQYACQFDDSRHPQPKGLLVTQQSFVSARLAHKDFVVIEYRIRNTESSPISGLYAAVACDFRTMGWNLNDGTDYGGTDSLRTMAFVRSANSGETLALGVRPIYPSGLVGWANCIKQATYINDGFTKSEKFQFMNGTLRSPTGTTAADWEAMSAVGPFTIAAGDSQTVAFVICGGRTAATLAANSDTAAEWYDPPTGVEEHPQQLRQVTGFSVVPPVFSGTTTIRYSLAHVAPFDLVAFDAAGRVADRLTVNPVGLTGSVNWRPAQVDRGIYFLKVGDQSQKAVIVR